MKKESFTVYYGGFLLNAPAPLELSLNYCNHRCPFCFANLNNPERQAYPQQIFSLLANAFKRDEDLTLAQHLIRMGYPIQFSNHVDPFAGNNYELTLRILEQTSELGIPLTIQTKGGVGLLKKPSKYHCSALDLIGPSVFYVSLETLDDDISKNISAPGAPRSTLRLEMIAALRSRGHRVNVGINPVVPQWIPDPELMVDTLKNLGVEGVWIQPLHLSHKQIAKMPDRDKQRLGEEILDQALVRNHAKYPAIGETMAALRDYANKVGLPVYDSQQAECTDYFKPYIEVYPRRYPLMQEFVNWCWEYLDPGDLVYFETWADMVLEQLPEGVWPIGQHIGAIAGPRFWSLVRDLGITNKMSYRELLRLIWDYKESGLCPVNVKAFRWAGDHEKQRDGTMGWTRWLDDNNQPILVFDPHAKDELWSQQYF